MEFKYKIRKRNVCCWEKCLSMHIINKPICPRERTKIVSHELKSWSPVSEPWSVCHPHQDDVESPSGTQSLHVILLVSIPSRSHLLYHWKHIILTDSTISCNSSWDINNKYEELPSGIQISVPERSQGPKRQNTKFSLRMISLHSSRH